MSFEWTRQGVAGLALAIETATKAHGTQLDKANELYIFHPIRVMLNVPSSLKRVAVLHDVIEDTDYTFADLSFLSDEESVILDLLTRKEGQLYRSYIERVSSHKGATIIKIEDLKDNMAPERMDKMPMKYRSLIDRYDKAYHFLMDSLKSSQG
jgi:(p)ppGpp synthase/HD superfamily hydrolase